MIIIIDNNYNNKVKCKAQIKVRIKNVSNLKMTCSSLIMNQAIIYKDSQILIWLWDKVRMIKGIQIWLNLKK